MKKTPEETTRKNSLMKGAKSFSYSSSFRVSANFCSVEHGLGITVETDGTKEDFNRKFIAAKIELEKILDELMPEESSRRMQKVQKIRTSFEK